MAEDTAFYTVVAMQYVVPTSLLWLRKDV